MLEQRWAVREPGNIFAGVRHHPVEVRIPKARAQARAGRRDVLLALHGRADHGRTSVPRTHDQAGKMGDGVAVFRADYGHAVVDAAAGSGRG